MGIEEICKVANWKPSGGASPTPTAALPPVGSTGEGRRVRPRPTTPSKQKSLPIRLPCLLDDDIPCSEIGQRPPEWVSIAENTRGVFFIRPAIWARLDRLRIAPIGLDRIDEGTSQSRLSSLSAAIGDRRDSLIAPIIPVGKSTWWQGVREGRYPKPIKIGARATAWRVEALALDRTAGVARRWPIAVIRRATSSGCAVTMSAKPPKRPARRLERCVMAEDGMEAVVGVYPPIFRGVDIVAFFKRREGDRKAALRPGPGMFCFRCKRGENARLWRSRILARTGQSSEPSGGFARECAATMNKRASLATLRASAGDLKVSIRCAELAPKRDADLSGICTVRGVKTHVEILI